MTPDESAIADLNARFFGAAPEEMIRWAHDTAPGRVVVSTNFRPYEAVILHAVTRIIPDVPVLWVDHGYNRAATYRHAEDLRARLGLNVKAYLPAMTVAHREAVHGPVPSLDDEAGLKAFSAVMKIEPFRRGMRELAPAIWITGLRRVQNPGRAKMHHLEHDANFGTLKLSPFLDWTDAQMEACLEDNSLPNEWDYFDPAKADEKRECGLHASWARDPRAQAAGVSDLGSGVSQG